jgi:hypothetical protein
MPKNIFNRNCKIFLLFILIVTSERTEPNTEPNRSAEYSEYRIINYSVRSIKKKTEQFRIPNTEHYSVRLFGSVKVRITEHYSGSGRVFFHKYQPVSGH